MKKSGLKLNSHGIFIMWTHPVIYGNSPTEAARCLPADDCGPGKLSCVKLHKNSNTNTDCCMIAAPK